MKKILLIILSGVLVLFLVVPVTAGSFLPKRGKEFSRWDIRNWGVKKVEYIHHKSNLRKFAKKPTCYSFLTSRKVRWKSMVNYVINPTNSQGLDSAFVVKAIKNSTEEWDKETSKELMNDNYVLSTGPETEYDLRNGVNAISFGDRFSDPNVIAVTTIWYNRFTNSIVEFDITFENDYKWGDGLADTTKMDLQNISTHEIGHAIGLGDVYKSGCSLVTMYGYSSYGETKKRTLEIADITGLRTLYGY